MWESCPWGADLLRLDEAPRTCSRLVSMVSKRVQEAEPTGGRGEELLDGAADCEAARPPKFKEFMSVRP